MRSIGPPPNTSSFSIGAITGIFTNTRRSSFAWSWYRQASLAAFSQANSLQMAVVPPSLEDAFIHLMQGIHDPFGK